MKNAFFILLALFVVVPCAATDDDKPSEKPEAVEVLAPRELPLSAAVPDILDAPVIADDEERPGCREETRWESIQLAQYFMVVGLVMDVPPTWNIYGSLALSSGVYIQCKVRRAREKRRSE